MRRFAVMLMMAIAAQHAVAQCAPDWEDRTLPTDPSPRQGTMAAYDGVGIVMFGGDSPTVGRRDDTWLWRNGAWQMANPAVKPSRRYQHSMAYDSGRARTVLFGGWGPQTPILNDTWEWDGSAWLQRAPANSPPPRYSGAMAYDSVRGRVVLFGGEEPFTVGLLNDTWEWDGTNWTERVLGTKPSQRYGHGLAFDAVRGKVVLFGGSGTGASGEETWELDSSGWVQRFPAHHPAWRYGQRLFFDVSRSRTVLFGGFIGSGSSAETWEWDGSDWVQLTTTAAPSGRFFHAMAYDVGRSVAVVFGGTSNFSDRLGGTFEYSSLSPADFDGDGFVTGADFDAYVVAFENGDTTADFDRDGFVTGIDFDQYVQAFEAGC